MRKNITIVVFLVIGLAGIAGGTGIGFMLTFPSLKHEEDNADYWQNEHNDLNDEYDDLLNNYQILTNDYDTLFDNYGTLQIAYNSVCNTIKQTILPVQYSVFAEAVRRYYMPLYLTGQTDKEWYMDYTEFCRDIILHETFQENSFADVSNAFSDALSYGSNTMYLAEYIMYWTFYDWLPYWGINLTTNELYYIDAIVDWCIDEIDYEYDSDIIVGQENPTWDYPKFPVETAFRTLGDCEDQAILAAAYLESCGFETAIAISHDSAHPTLGAFYHGHLLVHIEDTVAYNLAHSAPLWTIPNDPYIGYTWAWLDTTWDVPFGSTPTWLQSYIDFGGLTEDSMTIAFCDIDGAIA